MQATTKDAYRLFHRGSIALAQVEANGIRVDVDYIDKQLAYIEEKTKELTRELKEDPIWKRWKRRFGDNANLDSSDQLAEILFIEMGHKVHEWTEGREDKKTGKIIRRPKATETALRDTGLPFCDKYIRRGKISKAGATFLKNLKRECKGDLVHTFFNLAGGTTSDKKGDPRTYRSSSDSPNLHNQPKRDEEQAELVRRSFIPRKGRKNKKTGKRKKRLLIEADFKGIEVSIAYCYHKDPVMRKYLLDKSSDMHRDVAIQAFKLDPKLCPVDWWKDDHTGGKVRYSAKNKFTFPQFYGDYWKQCAKNLWEDIVRMDLKTSQGVSLYDHLKSKGIKRLGNEDKEPTKGTFEFHIKEVEYDFWKRRFRVYDKWKKKWYDEFLKKGYFQMKTGFICRGLHNRKQVINYPVQGAAFHCLLWCLIELQKWLNENKMETLIVCQIHDSMILDAPEYEVHEVVAKLREIMKKELLEAWDWITIPLEVDISVTDTNWWDTVKYEKFYGVAA